MNQGMLGLLSTSTPPMVEALDIMLLVHMLPKGKDRVRMGHGRLFKTVVMRKWEGLLADKAAEVFPPGQLGGTLRVDLFVAVQRPEYMCKRFSRPRKYIATDIHGPAGVNEGYGDDLTYKYPLGLIWCPKTPDRDNHDKAVLDSLKPFWTDDAIIVSGEILKYYAEFDGRPRIKVRIRREARDPDQVATRLGFI